MQRRKRKDELAAPFGDVRKLLGQLGLEVPWQREHDVGSVLVDLDRVENRDTGAWCETSVFVRIAIHGVLEQITADAAIVEQRVALTGCPITDDSLALGAV